MQESHKRFFWPHLSYSNGDVDFEFSYAFQPIVNARKKEIISFEALVRGPKGEPAASILSRVSDENIYLFDDIGRRKAIEIVSRQKIFKGLNINLSAKELYQVDLNITATFKASRNNGFPVENIIFEVTESECLTDRRNILNNLKLLQEFGFMTAIDDFGMGYSGIKLLLEYQPNYIKLDRALISNIKWDKVKQSVFLGTRRMCEELSIDIVAEGVETAEEYQWLHYAGVDIFQGYYFARPAFETLPNVSF
jgi:EAL domain-containing protein (putative c-di-GMP-specific phosphodiesterase class I)